MQHYQKHQELAIERCSLEDNLSQTLQVRRLDVHDAYFQAAVLMNSADLTSDKPSDDELDSDDIVANDTETSCYTTLSDRVRREC